MNNILKNRSFVYVFLAMWVLIFHCACRVEMVNIPFLTSFVEQGNMAVDIFMFLSGYCLWQSFAKASHDIRGFAIKRIMRLLIPYLVISIPFYIWRCIYIVPNANGGFNLMQFMKFITSYSFWLGGVQTSWFVYAITVFCVMLPFIYAVVHKRKHLIWLILLLSYIFNFICFRYIPLYRSSSICWTRMPIFVLGIAMSLHSDRSNLFMNSLWVRIASVLILLISFSVIPVRAYIIAHDIPYETLWLMYGPMSLSMLVVGNYLLGVIELNRLNKKTMYIINLFGGLSLEIYMIHVWVCFIFDKYEIWTQLGAFSYLVVAVLGISITLLFKPLIEKVKNRVIRKV